jgi:hypothetical protein
MLAATDILVLGRIPNRHYSIFVIGCCGDRMRRPRPRKWWPQHIPSWGHFLHMSHGAHFRRIWPAKIGSRILCAVVARKMALPRFRRRIAYRGYVSRAFRKALGLCSPNMALAFASPRATHPRNSSKAASVGGLFRYRPLPFAHILGWRIKGALSSLIHGSQLECVAPQRTSMRAFSARPRSVRSFRPSARTITSSNSRDLSER